MTIQVAVVTGDLPIPGECAYIGTSPRSWDVGIVRIRGASGTTINVSDNEIEWNSGLYIWCPRTFPPMARIQRVEDVGGRATVWKDTDITPVPLPPKANIISPLFWEAGTWTVVTVSAQAMEAGASISSLSLSAYPDGDVTGAGPSFSVRFPTPGYKLLVATATDSNGQTGRMVLPALVDVDDSAGVIVDSVDWSVASGYEVQASFPPMAIRPLAPAFMKYGEVELLLWIWLDEENRSGMVTRTEGRFLSSVGMLDKLVSHAFVLEDGDRDSWYRVPELTGVRAVHLLLEFHSTFNLVTPVFYQSARLSMRIKSQKFGQGSVLSQLRDLLADACSNPIQQGVGVTIWEEPLMRWDRSSISVHPVTPVSVRESDPGPIGELRCGGFGYDTPYLSRFPGTTPEIWARREEREGFIVSDQRDLNRLAGLLAAFQAAPSYHLSLAEDFSALPPFTSLWRCDTIKGSPQAMSARHSTSGFLVEVELKQERPAAEGETIVIPPAPDPTPPEIPAPPIPPPPPYQGTSGTAMVRCGYVIMRTSNIYSQSPEWEPVFDVRGQSNIGPIVDFRYVERSGGVSVVVLTQKGLYYTSDPFAGTVSWTPLLNREQIMTIVGSDSDVANYHLITLVQDGNYIGFFTHALNSNYSHKLMYVFTNNWGASWDARVIATSFVYLQYPWTVYNRPGTDEIGCFHSTGIYGSTLYFKRSTDRGQNWSLVKSYNITVISMKIVKPWQSGSILYATGDFYGWGWRVAKSTDDGGSFAELIGDSNYYIRAARDFEYWTYDHNLVYAVLQYQSSQLHLLRTVNGQNFQFVSVIPAQTAQNGRIHGNPVNRDEWTVITIPQNPMREGVFAVQTLDGGATWRSIMGNWYEAHPDGRWDGKDYLLLPPFKSVRSV